jgi:hypothetical protein
MLFAYMNSEKPHERCRSFFLGGIAGLHDAVNKKVPGSTGRLNNALRVSGLCDSMRSDRLPLETGTGPIEPHQLSATGSQANLL